MQLKTIYIQERPENFAQWLTQFASERGFAISENRQDNLRLYSVKRDGEAVAEVETQPVGDRLRLRPARLRIQHTPDRIVKEDFIDILDRALQADYHAEPIESGISGSLVHWIKSGMEYQQFDNPKEEAKRQAYIAELGRGLPTIAPTEQTANQAMTTQETQSQTWRKRMISTFTSRFSWRYMLIGLILFVVVLVASLVVYPASSRSGETLLALIIADMIGVISVIAIFRQAFEIVSAIESDKTKLHKS